MTTAAGLVALGAALLLCGGLFARRALLLSRLVRMGKPVDRSEWVMDPHLVNAVNLPAMNAMNFPAGMLQPPYFDPARPEVMDYGSIGAVIRAGFSSRAGPKIE